MKKISTGLLSALTAALFLALPGAAFAGGYYDDYGYGYPDYYDYGGYDYGYDYGYGDYGWGYPAQPVYTSGYGMPIYGCYGQFQWTPCTTSYQPNYVYQQPSYQYQQPYTYYYPQTHPQQYSYNPSIQNTNTNTNTNINNIVNNNNSNAVAYAYGYAYVPYFGYSW